MIRSYKTIFIFMLAVILVWTLLASFAYEVMKTNKEVIQEETTCPKFPVCPDHIEVGEDD